MRRHDRALWWAIALPVLGLVLASTCFPASASTVPVMDVYTPAEPNGTAVLAVHGGGWYKGTRASMERVCTEVVIPTGATCFAPDYTLSGVAPFPAANRDLLAAVAHVRSLGFTRVGAIGSSAGGNLVGWLASRGVLDAAVLWSAPTDLTVLRDWPPRAIHRFAPTRWMRRAASPALRSLTGAILVVHARHDPLIPFRQARRLNRVLDSPHRLVAYPGTAHGLGLVNVAVDVSRDWLAAHLSPAPASPSSTVG